MERKQANHHSNQKNPNNVAHKLARDNRANQKNPNNPAYVNGKTTPAKGVKAK